MALTAAQVQFIQVIQRECQNQLAFASVIEQEDIMFNGDPDFNGEITQGDLDVRFPGLTTTTLADAVYALKLLKVGGSGAGIDNSKVPLTILANIP